jgi:hypothetical protein
MAREYSLWLTFDKASTGHTQLQQIITSLADTVEDAPEFEPHLTLVGGFGGDRPNLIQTVDTLSDAVGALTLNIGDIQCSTTAHQCIFCLVEPSLPLLRLRRQAMRTLGHAASMYVPHVSLIYSDLSLDQRRAIARAIDPAVIPSQVQATAIELVETSGAVTEWQSVYSVRL